MHVRGQFFFRLRRFLLGTALFVFLLSACGPATIVATAGDDSDYDPADAALVSDVLGLSDGSAGDRDGYDRYDRDGCDRDGGDSCYDAFFSSDAGAADRGGGDLQHPDVHFGASDSASVDAVTDSAQGRDVVQPDLRIPDWLLNEPVSDPSYDRMAVAVTMLGLSPPLPADGDYSDYSKGGDAFLIEDRRIMLIDTGTPEAARDVLVPALKAKGIWKLDYVLITHPHLDHYGGLALLLDEFDVGTVFAGGSGGSDYLQDIYDSLGGRYRRPATGQVIDLGMSAMKVVLSPSASFSANENDASIITRLDVGAKSMLFTGDCGPAEGDYLAAHHASELRCDVLKFPHHAQIPHAGLNMLDLTHAAIVVVPIPEPYWRWGIGRDDPSQNWYSADADGFIEAREHYFHEATLLFFDDGIGTGNFTQISHVYKLLLR